MVHFGEHLTIDGYRGDPNRLDSQQLVQKCLDELPGLLGMTRLADPQVYFAPGNGAKDPGGWSGFVVIVESHISIHTFPHRGFASIDVYTCRNEMNTDFILSYFRDVFAFESMEVNFILRGQNYPQEDIRLSSGLAEQESCRLVDAPAILELPHACN